MFARALSHSISLQLSSSQKGGDGGGQTHTSSGLTCTAGCLPSLLLGELSPVACCSRNWRATWRACKRDTAGWAGGRVPSSSSLLRARSPSSSQMRGRPDWFSTGLIHRVRATREEGSTHQRSLLQHQYDQYIPLQTTTLPNPRSHGGPRGPGGNPILFQKPLPHLQQVTRSSIFVPPAGFHVGHPQPPQAPALAQASPGQAQPAPERRSGRGAGSWLIYSTLAWSHHYISAAADIPCV